MARTHRFVLFHKPLDLRRLLGVELGYGGLLLIGLRKVNDGLGQNVLRVGEDEHAAIGGRGTPVREPFRSVKRLHHQQ